MKNFKVFGPLAVAAMMSFAATASADGLTLSTGGSTGTPTIHAVNENGHVTLQNPIGNISCSSTVEGTPSSHGAGIDVSGSFSHLTFTGCTNSWHVTTEAAGSFWISHTSGHNGELRSSGARVHATRFGVDCYYETDNTLIGTVTGGNPATLHIAANIPLDEVASHPLCGTSSAKWEGNYLTTSALYIENS